MDIADIATRETVEATPETRLGQVRSSLEEPTVGGVLVVEDDECVGVVTPKEALRSQLDDDASASRLAKPVPHVERTRNVRDVARLMVENETRVAPVVEGDSLWGSVTADDLLGAVTEHLDVLDVGDVQTTGVVSVTEDDTLGEAVNLMRENGVSRLPVVEDDGTLSGVLTTSDLVEFVVREGDQPDKGQRVAGDEALLDLPVYDAMTPKTLTTTPEATVQEAVETMLEEDTDGLVVSPEYAELVAGVVTKTDVLRALSYTEDDHLDVQITNVDLLRTTSREDVAARIEEVVDKHREMDVQHVHIRFSEHDEEFRGTNLVRCQVRLRSDEGSLAGTGESFGADEALSLALDRLERNVLEAKGRRDDEEYRGQLLRKLGEL